MPGIVGIIAQANLEAGRVRAQAMIESLQDASHCPSATWHLQDLGVYTGWLGIEGAPAGMHSDPTQNISLLLCGECYADSRIARGDEIVSLYQNHGDAFASKLNGLFCGLLIDRARRRVLLFNDRYGAQRIYFHERDGILFFATEARTLLRMLPEHRRFDLDGLADFLTFGCTLEWRTLFQGIQIMPGASFWSFEDGKCRKSTYFSPSAWENQPPLGESEFEDRFQETFKRILPRYFDSEAKIGIALTGGLDTRMIMACRPQDNGATVCYTFSGNNGCTLDDRIAAQVAAASNVGHQLVRLDNDFFSNFPAHVDNTILATDGCAGVFTAHEIYLNRKARELAPVRLTGNYGSEILRGHSTFKPLSLSPQLLNLEWSANIAAHADKLAAHQTQPVTFAAFKEIPWNLYGMLVAGRSQMPFRTPYLDNDLVALAYQTPVHMRRSSLPSVRLVRANNPVLGEIPTDRGFGGANSGLRFLARRAFAEFTFKLDYYTTAGLPRIVSAFNPLFRPVAAGLKIAGMHKFVRYSSWFRNELASYVRETLASARVRANSLWNPRFIARLADTHIAGPNDCSPEINMVLTVDAIERLLIHPPQS